MSNTSLYASRQLERLFAFGTVGTLTDGQLLEAFVFEDHELASQAFEVIVKRHGPMVLNICRAVLRDEHAAEDAFQATFMVLARKAPQLRARELLSHWLHGVALKTARKARILASRHRTRDRHVLASLPVVVEASRNAHGDSDLNRVLHEEINRLPQSYRAAIVVCYLQGLSQAQAARQLNLTESTVRGRLARGRKLLGQRLRSRGIEPCTGLAILDTSIRADRLLSDVIMQATVRAALCFVNRGQEMPGVISGMACGIADGVRFTMCLSPIKTMTVLLLLAGLLGSGAVSVAQRSAMVHVESERTLLKADSETTPSPLSLLSAEAVNSPRDKRNDSQATEPARVNSDLAKLAPGPIVRTMPVSKDCMILSYLPDWNFGNVDNIGIGNNDGGVRTLLDWPAIASDEARSSERRFLIALYSRKTISHPLASAVNVHELLEAWPERTSWRTKPSYEDEPAARGKFEPGDGWKLFDVTTLIRTRAKAGRKSHGVVLRFSKEDMPGGLPEVLSDYKLVSREGTGEWTDFRPVLLVVRATTPAKAD